MAEFYSVFAECLTELLEDWLASKHAENSMKYQLRVFDQFCLRVNYASALLTEKVVKDWLDAEKEKGADAVLRSRAATIRKLARHMIATGKDPDAYVLPSGYCKYKPNLKRPPYIFTDAELSAFFLAADNFPENLWFDKWAAKVTPVLFRVMYTCGLRPNEARELKKCDVHIETGEILVVHNKTRKERYVVMSDDMTEMCVAYEKDLRAFAPDSDYFFPRSRSGFYSDRDLTELFHVCWRLANPDVSAKELPKARPYDLRHRFASAVLNRWLDEGQDLYTMLPFLRAFMGHEKLSGTAYYIHMLPENLLKSPGVDWEKLNELIPEVDVWEE